jgi:cystathionine gamma-synthase
MTFESWLVSAGRDRRPGSPLNVPPCPASNFVLGERRAYSRDDGTPGWEALEEIVGGLEGGSAVSFASGMAAIAAIFDQLPAGSVVVLPDDCYQGVAGLAKAGQKRGRWTVHSLAAADTAGWIKMCGVADLIWLESPSNPLLTVADVDAICAAPRKGGAILGVDNTFATPLNQRPLALGADVSVQSATKFIGGHSDLLGGVVTVRDSNLLAALRQERPDTGRAPRAPSTRHADALSRPGEPPHSRCRPTPTPSALDCNSSNTPPASAPSSPPSNGGPAFPGRSTCHRRCCD